MLATKTHELQNLDESWQSLEPIIIMWWHLHASGPILVGHDSWVRQYYVLQRKWYGFLRFPFGLFEISKRPVATSLPIT